MKPNADLISGAMAAEAALAKEDGESYEKTLESLPDDHPLKVAATQQKRLLGDLGSLPPGHPVLLAMEEARQKYEAEQAIAEEVAKEAAEEEERKIKRVKRLDAKKAAREARNREEEESERRRAAAKSINSSMTETLDAVKRLSDNIAASQEDFAGDRYALMKLERLNRVLIATMRGIAESKINPGRVSNAS
jgi:hypothetical protein